MSPVHQLTDMGVATIPPVADRPVQRTVNGSLPPSLPPGGRRSPVVACWASDY